MPSLTPDEMVRVRARFFQDQMQATLVDLVQIRREHEETCDTKGSILCPGDQVYKVVKEMGRSTLEAMLFTALGELDALGYGQMKRST